MSNDQAEKLVRKLKKLDQNKTCADCPITNNFGHSSVSPRYKTFVCAMCKSAHQSFSHRIKSVTMSNWSMAEAQALTPKRGGSNDAARAKWLAKLTAADRAHFMPKKGDSLKKFKSWIFMVYEDKRFYGEGPVKKVKQPVQKAKAQAPKPKPAATKQSNSLLDFDDFLGSSNTSKVESPAPVSGGFDDLFAPATAPSQPAKSTSQSFDVFAPAPAPAPASSSGTFDVFGTSNATSFSMATPMQPTTSSATKPLNAWGPTKTSGTSSGLFGGFGNTSSSLAYNSRVPPSRSAYSQYNVSTVSKPVAPKPVSQSRASSGSKPNSSLDSLDVFSAF